MAIWQLSKQHFSGAGAYEIAGTTVEVDQYGRFELKKGWRQVMPASLAALVRPDPLPRGWPAFRASNT